MKWVPKRWNKCIIFTTKLFTFSVKDFYGKLLAGHSDGGKHSIPSVKGILLDASREIIPAIIPPPEYILKMCGFCEMYQIVWEDKKVTDPMWTYCCCFSDRWQYGVYSARPWWWVDACLCESNVLRNVCNHPKYDSVFSVFHWQSGKVPTFILKITQYMLNIMSYF